MFCHILYIDEWLARVYGHGAWDDHLFWMSNCRLSSRLKLLWHLSQVKLESGINSDDSLASIFHALNDSRSHVCALWELPLLLIWQVFSFIDWAHFNRESIHTWWSPAKHLRTTWCTYHTPGAFSMVKHTAGNTPRRIKYAYRTLITIKLDESRSIVAVLSSSGNLVTMSCA